MRNTNSFQWKIKNFSRCWLQKGKAIWSPTFEIYTSPPTKWWLVLYPKGVRNEDQVDVYLYRGLDDHGPDIKVGFEISFLDSNGIILQVKEKNTHVFTKQCLFGMEDFVAHDKIFGTESENKLPQDILIIQCMLYVTDEEHDKTKDKTINIASAVTTFRTINRSFFWYIYGFSTHPKKLNYLAILSETRKIIADFSISSVTNGDINLYLFSWDKSLKSFSIKISVIDSERKKVDFGNFEYSASDVSKKEPVITRKQLMKNKSRFLPNDVLSLVCEFAVSTGSILVCHDSDFGDICPTASTELMEAEDKPVVSQNEVPNSQSLVVDLKTVYNDAILSDIELRTPTQTFPAHKTILSARSSVFRRMFSNDWREKNSGHIDITDLENDTLCRMLLYIYTDTLEDEQFESASKLYSAADKYAIFSLKEKCSSILKEKMDPTKACDLLVLADRHQDEDLNCAVQDYILRHDKEIFNSQEWKDFMATNLQLAADIMYRKVSRS